MAKRRSAKSSQLARKPFNSLTTTGQSPKNNKITWLELARVGRGGQTVENLARVERKFELDRFEPTRSNSSQLEPSGRPNDTQLHPNWKLGSSWLELGVSFGQSEICSRHHSEHTSRFQSLAIPSKLYIALWKVREYVLNNIKSWTQLGLDMDEPSPGKTWKHGLKTVQKF